LASKWWHAEKKNWPGGKIRKERIDAMDLWGHYTQVSDHSVVMDGFC
jgi:hypothetical protein